MTYDQYDGEQDIPLYVEKVAAHVVDLAFFIHRDRGPGLLEKGYEFCLYHDLNDLGFFVKTQVSLPITHNDHTIERAYRVDLIVNDCLIVEIKTIEGPIQPIHRSQVLSYLKASGYRLGLIINFNTRYLKDGIRRVANSN
jgi:GxxExxY protein